MKGGKKRIALVVDAMGYHSRSFSDGCAKFVQERGWSARLLLVPELPSPAAMSRFDGVVARALSEEAYEILRRSGCTVVEAAVKGTGETTFSSVDCDEKALAESAAEHFLERGYVRFAFCGYPGVSFSDIRERHFLATLKARGIEADCFNPRRTRFAEMLVTDCSDDVAAVGEWAASLKGPVAVFCANDRRAYQILSACIERRIRVPERLAILGADDDLLYCSFNIPTISSIDPDARAIGYKAGETLAGLLKLPRAARKPVHVESPPGRLNVRGSTSFYPLEPRWLSDALVFIDENAAAISAAGVYAKVKKSHTAVDAAFASALGTTVQKRIMSVRMKEARWLVARDGLPITEIAAKLGFPSVQYFSGTFRLYFGVSPREFRKGR